VSFGRLIEQGLRALGTRCSWVLTLRSTGPECFMGLLYRTKI